MPTLHRILLITTGGTIAGEVAVQKQDRVMIRTADEFVELAAPTISFLNRRFDLAIELQSRALCVLDSSDILPVHWKKLAALIKSKYDSYDSFIITHGTNTLGYTCAALSFALANLDKPVILTGSQVPAGLPGNDGLTNLSNAFRVAVYKHALIPPMKGVLAVFGSHIISGTRVKKDTEFDYDAFKSFGVGSIGRIGRIIDIDKTILEKHLSYLSKSKYPALKAKDLVCENDFDMSIVSLTEFPGMSQTLFQTLVERENIRGFILRAFGAGDASSYLRKAFEYLKSKEIPIVVTTQAPNGNSNLQVNAPGRVLWDNDLAIAAYDMSIEAQTTKLAWLLAKRNKNELTYRELCEKMKEDLRGEVNVMHEVDA